jgi:hypothetical protein
MLPEGRRRGPGSNRLSPMVCFLRLASRFPANARWMPNLEASLP